MSWPRLHRPLHQAIRTIKLAIQRVLNLPLV